MKRVQTLVRTIVAVRRINRDREDLGKELMRVQYEPLDGHITVVVPGELVWSTSMWPGDNSIEDDIRDYSGDDEEDGR